jgi:hypothetical protein
MIDFKTVEYWCGDYVIVFPRRRVRFHKCVVCGCNLTFGAEVSETGVGPECAR